MQQRNTSVTLLAAGAAAGLTLTYLARSARARMRRPIMQAMTILAPPSRVEQFVESRESMAEALENKRKFGAIDRLQILEAPADRGTEVYLTMRGTGKYAIKDVLRRIKSTIETGEVATGRRYA